MMIQSLNNKGYNAFSFSVPSTNELATILGLAGPVFITMIAKVTHNFTLLSCLVQYDYVTLNLRYFNLFLGGFLLAHYIFCYLYGHKYSGRSSG